MGIYNTYGDCQIKAGNVDGTHYQIGDKCDLNNGNKIEMKEILDQRNPVIKDL